MSVFRVLQCFCVWTTLVLPAVYDSFSFSFSDVVIGSDPADELMPLSCEGRRWELRMRGTIDDALGYVAFYSYSFIFYLT